MAEKLRIDRYQQLVAWQSADALADLAESMVSSGAAKNDPEFCRQIRRSSAKAPAQIAEGWDADAFNKAWNLSETALKTSTGLLRAKLQQIAEEERGKRQIARGPKAQP